MKLLIIIILLLAAYLGYEYVRVQKTIKLSKKIVARTLAFQNLSQDTSISLLVLGDSTAVGVGSDNPEQTVPALFSKSIQATYVENHAVSGAKVQDLQDQLKKIKLKKYDYILVQIGGNNIVDREDPKEVGEILQKFYKTLPENKQVVHVCCGNVGATTILPWFIRGYYTQKTMAYHSVFEKIDMQNNVNYVNLYDPESSDPFTSKPDIYLAADGFHPSSLGYEYWFLKIQPVIQ